LPAEAPRAAGHNLAVETDGSPLEDEELERMIRRADAATAGPWKSSVEGRDHWSGDNVILTGGTDIFIEVSYYNEQPLDFEARVRNQDFIAAARQDVPHLGAEVRRLRALLREND
jgi:hypothetical protein